MPIAHINIGSNLGDSVSIIETAVAEITKLSSTPIKRSRLIKSTPWGYQSPNIFTNIGLEIATTLSPHSLLTTLLEIQKNISPQSHRTADGKSYIDRLIDIDLIFYDNLIIQSPALSLPHPRMHMRAFVLQPIAELSPNWTHPLFNKSALQLLEELNH